MCPLNRFLIKDLCHKLNLLRHLPLSSIIDDKIRPPCTWFSTRCRKTFFNPHLQNISTSHLHFDNSITGLHPQSHTPLQSQPAGEVQTYIGLRSVEYTVDGRHSSCGLERFCEHAAKTYSWPA